jgi:hypothetical protein
MFVMIRKYAGCADAQEVSRRFEPLAQRFHDLPGLKSYGMVDAGDGQFLTVGLFDTRDQAMQSVEVARSLIQEHNFADLLPDPPEIIMGEVLRLHRN